MVMIPVVPQPDGKQKLQDQITELQRSIAFTQDVATKRLLKEFEVRHLSAWQETLAQYQAELANYDEWLADQPVQVPRLTWKKFMQLWHGVEVWACLQCGTPTIVSPDIDLRDIHDPLCPNPPKKP